MENLLSIVSLVAGVGAGSLSSFAARRNPDNAPQLRKLGAMFFGIALLMAVLLLL